MVVLRGLCAAARGLFVFLGVLLGVLAALASVLSPAAGLILQTRLLESGSPLSFGASSRLPLGFCALSASAILAASVHAVQTGQSSSTGS